MESGSTPQSRSLVSGPARPKGLMRKLSSLLTDWHGLNSSASSSSSSSPSLSSSIEEIQCELYYYDRQKEFWRRLL